MKFKYKKKIINFIISLVLITSGMYYLGLNYVPKELYDTKAMQPDMPESFYVN